MVAIVIVMRISHISVFVIGVICESAEAAPVLLF